MATSMVSYLVLLLAVVFGIAVSQKTWTETTVERPLFIGSFNIQNLGQSKSSNKTIMDIVKKILTRYDLVLVQEIVTTDEDMMDKLVKDLNRMTPKGIKYMMTISERLGRGTAKEQYAFLYRNDKLKLIKAMSYPDTKDNFMRPPYIAHFATPTLRDMQSMVTIGIHTQPKNATNETSYMARVYDYAVKTFKVKDAIMMGDMNAGCANVRISDWDHIELWKRDEFTWLITHDMDTTLSTNCCPYDRFVIAGDNMENAAIWDSVRVFKYKNEFEDVSTELALAVSDHWPIEMKLRGGTSEFVETNLKPSLCLNVHDVRNRSVPLQIQKQKSTYGFSIHVSETWTSLYAESSEREDVLENLQKLSGRYPEFLAPEMVETILYKEDHQALEDASSHNDVAHSLYSANIYFDNDDKSVAVNYCVATTIN